MPHPFFSWGVQYVFHVYTHVVSCRHGCFDYIEESKHHNLNQRPGFGHLLDRT